MNWIWHHATMCKCEQQQKKKQFAALYVHKGDHRIIILHINIITSHVDVWESWRGKGENELVDGAEIWDFHSQSVKIKFYWPRVILYFLFMTTHTISTHRNNLLKPFTKPFPTVSIRNCQTSVSCMYVLSSVFLVVKKKQTKNCKCNATSRNVMTQRSCEVNYHSGLVHQQQ